MNNKIPEVWLKKSYPSLKTLMSYSKDLGKRIDMFKSWIRNKKVPKIFWLPGFYFT